MDTARDIPSETLPLPRRLLEAAVAASAVTLIYGAAGLADLPRQAPLALPIDAAIPFVPATVWLYLPGYWATFLLAVWSLREARAFRAALAAFLLMTVLATPFFLLWPVHGPRPAPPLDETVTAALVRWTYAHDPDVNTFPSLHIANATLAAVLVTRRGRWPGAVAWTLALGVYASVLLLKQHWIVDLPGGWALAAVGLAAWRGQVEAGTMFRRLRALGDNLRRALDHPTVPGAAPLRATLRATGGWLSPGRGDHSPAAHPARSRRHGPASPGGDEGTPRSPRPGRREPRSPTPRRPDRP